MPPTGVNPRLSRPLRVCLAGAVLLCACERDVVVEGIRVAERDSAGVVVVEIEGDVNRLPEWRLSPEPDFTIPGTAPPYFTSIGEVEWLSDGRVVVEDNQHDAVYLFAANGTYLRPLGGQGDGPGEYRSVTEMTVLPGDTVYLYDRRHDRLSVVHPDTGFVRSVRYGTEIGGRPPLDVFALDRDRFLVEVPLGEESEGLLPRRVPNMVSLFLTDGAGRVMDGPVTFQESVFVEFRDGTGSAAIGPRAIMAVAQGRLVHGTGQRYELTVRDADFDPVRMIRWAGWNEPVPAEEVEALRQKFLEDYSPHFPREWLEQVEEAQFSPELLPDDRPALGRRSFLDEAGRIWLSRYEPESLPDVATQWHVLSPRGRPLGRLTLPPGVTLAAVRENRVMLVVPDELDLQSLVVYAIEP